MRMFIVLAIVVAVVAIGLVVKTGLVPGSAGDPASINRTIAASATLWPHEIHRNYQGMKDLPATEVKEPF